MGSCSTKQKIDSGYQFSMPTSHPPTSAADGKSCPVGYSIEATSVGGFVSTFDPNVKVSLQTVFEHYQPYEFPIVPIINSHTQSLVRASFKKILDTEFESEDTVSGKMSGATYFYNQFFKQLFLRLRDFERIFPDIKSRAEIISKVMAMVLSIRVEELQLAKARLKSLGAKHVHIVQDPWLFGVYVTTIHSTVRLCLGDDANEDVMSAWLHLLAWVLRNIMPEYLERLQFDRYFDGATNAAAAVTEKHREEIKTAADVLQLRSAMRSANRSGTHTAGGSHLASPPPEKEHSSHHHPHTHPSTHHKEMYAVKEASEATTDPISENRFEPSTNTPSNQPTPIVKAAIEPRSQCAFTLPVAPLASNESTAVVESAPSSADEGHLNKGSSGSGSNKSSPQLQPVDNHKRLSSVGERAGQFVNVIPFPIAVNASASPRVAPVNRSRIHITMPQSPSGHAPNNA